MKNLKNKIGFSLTEILVALAILGLLAIPMYSLFSYSAAEEKAYHKTVAAKSIMQAMQDEVKNIHYDLVDKYSSDLGGKTLKLSDYAKFPPKTGDIIQAQAKKFDPEGAEIKIETEKTKDGAVEIIKMVMTINWKQRGSDRTEKTTFVKVK